jgi:hypothetical protein
MLPSGGDYLNCNCKQKRADEMWQGRVAEAWPLHRAVGVFNCKDKQKRVGWVPVLVLDGGPRGRVSELVGAFEEIANFFAYFIKNCCASF